MGILVGRAIEASAKYQERPKFTVTLTLWQTPAIYSPDHFHSHLSFRPSNVAVSFMLANIVRGTYRLFDLLPLPTRAAVSCAEKWMQASGTCSNLHLSPPSTFSPYPNLAYRVQTPHHFGYSSAWTLNRSTNSVLRTSAKVGHQQKTRQRCNNFPYRDKDIMIEAALNHDPSALHFLAAAIIILL